MTAPTLNVDLSYVSLASTFGRLAQSAERRTVNPQVTGSSPVSPANMVICQSVVEWNYLLSSQEETLRRFESFYHRHDKSPADAGEIFESKDIMRNKAVVACQPHKLDGAGSIPTSATIC